MFMVFISFIPTLLGIVSLLQGFWGCKNGIKYPASRAFFPVCFLLCMRQLRGRHLRRLACLLGLFMFARIACLLQL